MCKLNLEVIFHFISFIMQILCDLINMFEKISSSIFIIKDRMITITIPKWLVIQMTPKQEQKALSFNKI